MTTVDQPTAQGWVADDSTFGARLALIRQRMKWGNLKEAAIACGLPPESWRSWERDGRAPQRLVEVATIIAHRTGCDRNWLVMGPAGTAGTPNVRLDDLVRSALPRTATRRHLNSPRSGHVAAGVSPSAPQRRDSTRPPSPVPVTRRRPVAVKPPTRPMAG